MCGNDSSTIASPNSNFYNLIHTQVPTKRIAMSTPHPKHRKLPSRVPSRHLNEQYEPRRDKGALLIKMPDNSRDDIDTGKTGPSCID